MITVMPGQRDPEELLEAADARRKEAKEGGRPLPLRPKCLQCGFPALFLQNGQPSCSYCLDPDLPVARNV